MKLYIKTKKIVKLFRKSGFNIEEDIENGILIVGSSKFYLDSIDMIMYSNLDTLENAFMTDFLFRHPEYGNLFGNLNLDESEDEIEESELSIKEIEDALSKFEDDVITPNFYI